MSSEGLFHRIYQVVARIPAGSVATYGQVGMLVGSPFYARRVGLAMSTIPDQLDLPCHRVVSSKGCLAPPYAFGGEGMQRSRLESEGVCFLPSGCVDLRASLWRPSPELCDALMNIPSD